MAGRQSECEGEPRHPGTIDSSDQFRSNPLLGVRIKAPFEDLLLKTNPERVKSDRKNFEEEQVKPVNCFSGIVLSVRGCCLVEKSET